MEFARVGSHHFLSNVIVSFYLPNFTKSILNDPDILKLSYMNNVCRQSFLPFQIYLVYRLNVKVELLIGFGVIDGIVVPKSDISINPCRYNLFFVQNYYLDLTIMTTSILINRYYTFDKISLPK